MSLATLTSKELSQIQKLIERKEALAQQIVEINSELEAIESGAPEPARPKNAAVQVAVTSKSPEPAAAPTMPRKKRRARRTVLGSLKERISDELKSAGKPGMKIKDLAASLGTSYGNITNFFQKAGKHMKEIKKVGPGRFAWMGA
jgi:ribosome-binding protein aMBF1 (putative translation factor)